MESKMVNVRAEDIQKLIQDVALIKNKVLAGAIYDDEGELSDWAINELEKARNIPDSEMLSSEEVKKMILAK